MTLILVPCFYRIVYDVKDSLSVPLEFIKAKISND
jgi:hypothetical protein